MGNRGPAKGTGGRPRKSLTDKVLDGQAGRVILPETAELPAEDMPRPRAYLNAAQHGEKRFYAAEIHEKVLIWLKKFHCEALVEPHIIELYALYSARWIMCEEAISEYGLLAKHPTTRQPIATPYASMSQNYAKQAAALWSQMQAIVRENSSVECGGWSPQDDVMERLLAPTAQKSARRKTS